MKYDIICIGGGVMDIFLDTEAHENGGEMCYTVGAKIKVKELKFSTGGGGTNTATGYSRLGLKTGYLGKLGNDQNAEIILKELKKEGVDFLGVLGKENTGLSVILDSKKHDRTILTYKGVNDKLKYSEIKKDIFNTKWIYLSTAAGEFLKTQEKIVKDAVKRGIKVAFNASLYEIKEEEEKVKNLLRYTDIFILNKEEAEELVGKKDIFDKLKLLGPKIVCVTDGRNGSDIYDGKKNYHIEAHKVNVVEATGAGDAFACGFVFGMIKFNDIDKAARIGTLNAESVIQNKGAKIGLLKWNEIRNKI